jgi:hypothetical protein
MMTARYANWRWPLHRSPVLPPQLTRRLCSVSARTMSARTMPARTMSVLTTKSRRAPEAGAKMISPKILSPKIQRASLVVEQRIVHVFVEVRRSILLFLLGVDFDFPILFLLVVVVVLFFFLLAITASICLDVDTGLCQLRFYELEQLIRIIAAPFVEHVRQKLEEIPRIQTTLNFLDLFFREGFEHLFAKRFGVPLLDSFLRRESNLADRSPVEVDFHIPVCSDEARPAFRRMPSRASRGVKVTLRSAEIVAAGLLVLSQVVALPCAAQELPDLALPDPTLPAPTPPPISSHYLQYGVALTGEGIVSAGDVCPREPGSLPCILSGGGGLAVRFGYRAPGPWYVGGTYEFSRQDSANLLRLAILQQLRAEVRYHLVRATRLSPYLGAAVGGVLYGNEWGLDTWGWGSALGGGLEFQVTPSIVLNIALNYRQLFFRRWIDSGGQERAQGPLGFGLAHVIAFEFGFEIRDPLPRW